jgi:hypothetical protein
MVTGNMLVLEMNVENFREGEHADCFVVAFTTMNELV